MAKEILENKLNDKQLKYVVHSYIIPEREFDFEEIKTEEEFEDVKEGLKKFRELSEDEVVVLLELIQSGNYEL